ncbi:MAG TPA: hypothetical protein VK108_11740 [Pseudogracilibacillus sp.]|nr:hypothetical protein [Pseudogracilibacillus sp.]
MARDFDKFAGNKYSLRARSGHMIKRIDALSKSLGALGDLLVTTWMGIAMAVVTLGGGGALVVHAIVANNLETLVPNIPAIILISFGTILISINVVMTNPSMGSQFIVSTKFVFEKIKNRGQGDKTTDFRPFKFAAGINDQSVVEANISGRTVFLVMYRVKGTVSPVTFSNELNELARLDNQLLNNIEKDTILSTINSVQSANVELKKLPNNATEAMIRKRDINHAITSGLNYNQQLKTRVVLSAANLDVLRGKMESLESVFRKGMVVSFERLKGSNLKREYKDIYG